MCGPKAGVQRDRHRILKNYQRDGAHGVDVGLPDLSPFPVLFKPPVVFRVHISILAARKITRVMDCFRRNHPVSFTEQIVTGMSLRSRVEKPARTLSHQQNVLLLGNLDVGTLVRCV